MDWHALSPYLIPLLIAAIILRRVMRVQKSRTIRLERLWIFPALLLAVTLLSVGREEWPGLMVFAAQVIAALLGGAIGWFRVHTLEFSIDKESGAVSARATRLGALLVFGLIALRYFADVALAKLGLGSSVVHAADVMLIFTTAMLVTRSVHTWIRARALLAAQRKPAVTSDAPAGEDQGR